MEKTLHTLTASFLLDVANPQRPVDEFTAFKAFSLWRVRENQVPIIAR